MSIEWQGRRPIRFLTKSRFGKNNNTLSSFIAPRGFTLQAATSGHRAPRVHYGPGTIFQGQVNLHMLKPSASSCRLHVVLTGHQTISPQISDVPSSSSSKNTLFEVEHVLVDNEALAAKRHLFHFSIKFPMCNYPPTFQDESGRSVVYSVKAYLSIQPQSSAEAAAMELASPELLITYLPLVPAAVPRNQVIETAQIMDPATGEASIVATLDSSQRGMCPGESLPLTLSVVNTSQKDLQAIHLALVRQISFVTDCESTLHTAPKRTTIHRVTIPISIPSNRNMSWSQPVQFILPSSLNMVPTTTPSITPLFHIEYFLVANIPLSGRHQTLTDRSPFGPRQLTLPIINDTIFDTSDRSGQVDNSVNIKGQVILPFAPIPITMGTVASRFPTSRLKWPLPSHAEVIAKPAFVRDRFEEEMLKHFSSMESLMEEEEDEQDIAELVQEAIARQKSSQDMDSIGRNRNVNSGNSSSSGSEKEEEYATSGLPFSARTRRIHSTPPNRFRQSVIPRLPKSVLSSHDPPGLPPSPPGTSRTMMGDSFAISTLSPPQIQTRKSTTSLTHAPPLRPSNVLSVSPRSNVGRDLLMSIYKNVPPGDGLHNL
ncbi:hypothetical protein BGZ94_000708 [Podila epigama]|nr:hypothetical protein BGZ94_000708 [Podila epigama]